VRPLYAATAVNNSAKTAICAVYALVLAAVISGPECNNKVKSASLESLDPFKISTLQSIFKQMIIGTITQISSMMY